ncbi:hypothetical protein GQ457_06G019800 [Hibiscus cannabinus]
MNHNPISGEKEKGLRASDLHCTLEGCSPKVSLSGRAYVIICCSEGMRSRGPRPMGHLVHRMRLSERYIT